MVQALSSVVRPMLFMRLLVDAVETRHCCWLLSARYARGGEANDLTRVCCGCIENTDWGPFFCFFGAVPLTLQQRLIEKQRSPQRALAWDI